MGTKATALAANKMYNNAQEAFEDLFNKILKCGTLKEYNDDSKTTMAMHNVSFTIRHPRDRMIKTPWRKWNKKYAEREWAWYESKNRSVEELKKHAHIWDKMHGGDNIVNSNYGWQWSRSSQLAHIIELLKEDENTRQAWITIYDGKEHFQYKYDTPCTLSIGFYITRVGHNKEKALNMNVLMRSNDLVYGFCNDQYCFSKLQEQVARELGIRMGTYYHFAADMHIYKRHFDMQEKWLEEKRKEDNKYINFVV